MVAKSIIIIKIEKKSYRVVTSGGSMGLIDTIDMICLKVKLIFFFSVFMTVTNYDARKQQKNKKPSSFGFVKTLMSSLKLFV